MKDGYWINYRTGKIISIPDHERWIRDAQNAKKLGVPEGVHTRAKGLGNRETYLLFLMENAPIIRVRGHGTSVTFEMHSRERQDVMDAIWMWGKQNAGPFTWMNITNFATKENTQMTFDEFEKQMDSGGAEAVLRVAGATSPLSVQSRVVRELLSMSKELLAQG